MSAHYESSNSINNTVIGAIRPSIFFRMAPRSHVLSDFSRQIRFMVNHGLDVRFHAVSEAVHWVVEGCHEEMDGGDVIPTLDFLVGDAGISANVQVGKYFSTPYISLNLPMPHIFFLD